MACCAVAAYVIMRMLSIHHALQSDERGIGWQTSSHNASSEKPTTDNLVHGEDRGVCRLRITGITCAACVKSIESALLSAQGVRSAAISLVLSQAVVHYDPEAISLATIIAIVEDLGYEIETAVASKNVSIGIKAADAKRQKLILQSMNTTVGATISTIIIVVLVLLQNKVNYQWRLSGGIALQALLCAAVVLFFGRDIHRESYNALRMRRSNMSLLTSLGTLLSFAESVYQSAILVATRGITLERPRTHFDSTAILTCVILGGRLLKAMVIRRSTASLTSLATLMPESAALLMDGIGTSNVTIVPSDTLSKGDRVVIHPGAVVPADGIIEKGISNIVEAHMTGEILPVARGQGAKVFAGSLNLEQQFIIQVTEAGQASWLEKSLQLMTDGDMRKVEMQDIADRVGEWFVLIILALSFTTGLAGWWYTNLSWSMSLNRMIAVLLAACPCALGLGTPTAVMMGTGIAAKANVLWKGGSHAFEMASRTKTVLFDMTGTITTGKISVQSESIAAPWDASPLSIAKWWSAVLAAEASSKHPVALAIADHACQKLAMLNLGSEGVSSTRCTGEVIWLKSIPGLGVKCSLILNEPGSIPGQQVEVIIGSRRFLERSGITVPAGAKSSCVASSSETQHPRLIESFVALNREYAGRIACSDEIRCEAVAVITKLKNQGFNVGMLTGGITSTAQSVAQKVGIHPSWVWAEVLPEAKLEVINSVRAQHGPVTMIGDNLNDIPAMTAADFSIAAFIDTGSITAVAADALLVEVPNCTAPCSLLQVPYVFALAREVVSKIKQNLAWAMLYNLVAIFLCMGFLEGRGASMSPFYAGLGMSLSSTLVLVNTMRLERWDPKEYRGRN